MKQPITDWDVIHQWFTFTHFEVKYSFWSCQVHQEHCKQYWNALAYNQFNEMHASPLVSCLLIGADNSSRYRKQYSGANTADSQVHDTLSAANTAVTADIQVHDISHTSFASQTEGSTFNDGCLPKTWPSQQSQLCKCTMD
jgi:hypothetical protein